MPESARISPKLYFVANLVEKLVPHYDIKQSDPVLAAGSMIGNCIAKNAISAVMLERAKFTGSQPALAWNRNTHPKFGDDFFGAPRVLNGHAYLLASGVDDPNRIAGISYNPGGIVSTDWEIFDFNEDDQYANVDDQNNIVATQAGTAVGYVVNDWHEGARGYMEALGVFDSVFHETTKEQMSGLIIAQLVERDEISSYSEFI